MEAGKTLPDSKDINCFEVLQRKYHSARKDGPVRQAWAKVDERILSPWCKSRPGTQPYAWWEYDAPRESIDTWPGTHRDGKLFALRKRLSGTGTPTHEKLSFGPRYIFGIPTDWVFPVLLTCYPDKDLKPIDSYDPPVFESQARYLDRY
jgi:hypothetical protein